MYGAYDALPLGNFLMAPDTRTIRISLIITRYCCCLADDEVSRDGCSVGVILDCHIERYMVIRVAIS
jgi:hypothetical protein